ncbi:MAG TPA: hypothetical protein VFJ16_12010 [Longimicrobium sp.]|nr:hypothetical protein [Longimicrobium sp.]
MIQLHDPGLPADEAEQLRKLQDDIDAIPDYAARVQQAKEKFKRRNTANDPLFRVVRQTLARMCHGPVRCGYCEDSAADEVEHVRPKDLYPEVAFEWTNYLYACGPCNGPKNNRFAVFSRGTGAYVEVTRRSRQPVVPPEPGDPVLINPRLEDPLQYLEIDLLDTFYFLPVADAGSPEHRRAEYTIEVLRLNDRDFLVVARRAAYGHYLRLLRDYVANKRAGSPSAMADLHHGIRWTNHRTVWKEMQRQKDTIPELRVLFDEAPEAMTA